MLGREGGSFLFSTQQPKILQRELAFSYTALFRQKISPFLGGGYVARTRTVDRRGKREDFQIISNGGI